MAKARGVRLDDENVEIAKELFSSSAEHPTPVQATVSGKIPEWFEGTLLRVGPGDVVFLYLVLLVFSLYFLQEPDNS